jgi:rhodanese-related sulfurtransferase
MAMGPQAYVEIDVAEARQRHEAGAVLLDVRNPDEWAAGRAEGSTWIPMNEVTARQDELPRDREIVVVCAVGARSAKVAQALNAWGFTAANLAGGLAAWTEAGHPLVTDDGSPGTLS